MKTNTLKILFFGMTAEATGCREVETDCPATTGDLQKMLVDKYPLLKTQKHTMAVNGQVVNHDHHPLQPGDEIALLPPFSGG
jgi:molybdopterin synthase sulfur carrier subunit